MTVHKTAGFFHLMKLHNFAQGLYAYTSRHVPFDNENTEYYFIYLDSSKLFPTVCGTIDYSDFTKIFLKQPQPRPQTTKGLSTNVTQGGATGTTTSGNNGSRTDINRLADILEK